MKYPLSLSLLAAGFWSLPEYPVFSTIVAGLGSGICLGLIAAYYATSRRFKLALRTKTPVLSSWNWIPLAILVFVSFAPFIDALHPGLTLFSNDGPLGVMSSAHLGTTYPGCPYWDDLHWLGSNGKFRPFMPSTLLTSAPGFVVLLFLFISFSMFTLKPSNKK